MRNLGYAAPPILGCAAHECEAKQDKRARINQTLSRKIEDNDTASIIGRYSNIYVLSAVTRILVFPQLDRVSVNGRLYLNSSCHIVVVFFPLYLPKFCNLSHT